MQEREISQSIELAVVRNLEEGRKEEAAANGAAVLESLAKKHEALFAVVERHLPAVLLERLRAKAVREREFLSQSFERERQVVAAAKKAVYVLNKTFFRVIRLEPHIFD